MQHTPRGCGNNFPYTAKLGFALISQNFPYTYPIHPLKGPSSAVVPCGRGMGAQAGARSNSSRVPIPNDVRISGSAWALETPVAQ